MSSGKRIYGVIDNDDGTSIGTEFWCMSGLPLLPLRGVRLLSKDVDGPLEEAEMSSESVIAGYWKQLGWIFIAVPCVVMCALPWLFGSMTQGPKMEFGFSIQMDLISIAVFACYAWTCWRWGRRPARRQGLVGKLPLVGPIVGLAIFSVFGLSQNLEGLERRCPGNLDRACRRARAAEGRSPLPCSGARCVRAR